jgi:nitrogen regulatory protein PII
MRELYEADVGPITAYAVHGIRGETSTFLYSKRLFEVHHLPESIKLEVVWSEESNEKIIKFVMRYQKLERTTHPNGCALAAIRVSRALR